MSERPTEMVGTALTGHGWQTYYVSADGDLLVHVGDTATEAEPLQLLGHYETVEIARAVARHRLRRDVRLASEDMRVAFSDIGELIRVPCPALEWAAGAVTEAPVCADTVVRAMGSLIRR